MQKQQALAETELKVEQGKSQFEIQRMQIEADIKKQMLELQYGYDMKLKSMEIEQSNQKEKDIEDRKDQRTRIEGTQQSEMINQRNLNLPPINFNQTEQTEQPIVPPSGM